MSSFDANWRDLQLETLVDLSLSVGGVRPEEELVEGLLQRAVGTLDASVGLVVSLRPSGQIAVVRAVGMQPDVEVARVLLGEEAWARLQAGESVRADRETLEPPFELVAVPLTWRDAVLGFAILGDKESRGGRIPFSDSDSRFLLSLSSLVATAISTSRHVAAVERDKVRLEEELRALRDVARKGGFVGASPPIERMLDLMRRVAPTEVSVMLRGESGVGKERVARLLHSSSMRKNGPFMPLNCAALPESLLEAELFGIEEGVATGVTRRLGKVELADGGTLFLDEVADLSLSLQAKLLRVVQEREFERLGGRERIPVDLRLITATNQDLEAMIEGGAFRSDLYYRLRVVVILVPPLRERRTDVPLLVRHFLEVYGERFGRPGIEMDREAVRALSLHPFPGNVRELENLIQAAVALAPTGGIISVEDLGLDQGFQPGGLASPGRLTLDEVERRHIEGVVRDVGGNRGEAARVLGIDRSTLYRKMRRFAPDDA